MSRLGRKYSVWGLLGVGFLGLLALLAYRAWASVTVLYVDSVNGNDANNGTSPALAWKTLQKVNSQISGIGLKSGQSILFMAGDTWTPANATAPASGPMIVLPANKLQGTVSAPVTFSTYGTGAAPVFDGNGVNTAGFSYSATAPMTRGIKPNISYVAIKGFEIKNNTQNGVLFLNSRNSWQPSFTYSAGTQILDGNHNIQQVTVAGTSGANAPGWAVKGATHDGATLVWNEIAIGSEVGIPGITISNNIIHNNGPGAFASNSTVGPSALTTGETCTSSSPAAIGPCDDGAGRSQLQIDDQTHSDNAIQIINNQVYAGGGRAEIFLRGDSAGGLIQGNTVHGWISEGIEVSNAGLSSNAPGVTVSNNLIFQDTYYSAIAIREAFYYAANFQQWDGATPIGRVLVMNNTTYKNAGVAPGFQCDTGLEAGGSAIAGTTTCQLYNNTLYDGSSDPLVISTSLVDISLDVRSNILDSSAPISICGLGADNTCGTITNWDFNDNGGLTGGAPVVSGLNGMSAFGSNDFNNQDPGYNNLGAKDFTIKLTSVLIGSGDSSLIPITNNGNIGAFAGLGATPTPTTTPTITPTPTGGPTATPTGTPTPPPFAVDQSLRDLAVRRKVAISGGSGLGDYVSNVDLNDSINPLAYGAKCDGVTDDSAAFTTAMAKVNAKGWILALPNATCVVNVTLNLTADKAGIFGRGRANSILTTTSPSIVQINATPHNWKLQGFRLTRTAQGTAGAYGVSGCFTILCGEPVIKDVEVLFAQTGLQLGPAYYGLIQDTVVNSSTGNGIVLQGALGSNILQWKINNTISQQNGSNGFLALAVAGGGSGDLAPWVQPYTFANRGNGIALVGANTTDNLNAGQIQTPTSSADCFAGIVLDTFGFGNQVNNSYIELTGYPAFGCTAGVGQGIGIYVTPDGNNMTSLMGNAILNTHWAGIQIVSNTHVSMVGNYIKQSFNSSGIIVAGGSSNITNIIGGFSSGNAQYGLAIYSGLAFEIGLACENNVNGPVLGKPASAIGGPC